MIFCCDFWDRNNYPKFYANTASMMKSMDCNTFLADEDLETFVRNLKKQIEKDKPKGHTAHVYYGGIHDNGRGVISIDSGKGETDIARLHLHRVRKIKTYGFESLAAFDVYKILQRDEV